MSILKNPSQIPVSYGIRIGAGLIAFFVLMRLVGLHHHVELRLLNLAIVVAGVWFCLKKFRETHGAHLNYFRALITGVTTSSVGSFIFAVFMFFYMVLDQSLMQSIIDNEPMGRFFNPYIVSFIVGLEGSFSGLLVTFVLINYINTDEVGES